jgi:hypothetical protein
MSWEEPWEKPWEKLRLDVASTTRQDARAHFITSPPAKRVRFELPLKAAHYTYVVHNAILIFLWNIEDPPSLHLSVVVALCATGQGFLPYGKHGFHS